MKGNDVSIGTARSDSFEISFNRSLQGLPIGLLLELLRKCRRVWRQRLCLRRTKFGAIDGGGSRSWSWRCGIRSLAGPGQRAIVKGRRVKGRGLLAISAFGRCGGGIGGVESAGLPLVASSAAAGRWRLRCRGIDGGGRVRGGVAAFLLHGEVVRGKKKMVSATVLSFPTYHPLFLLFPLQNCHLSTPDAL
jgi:hypothetical protein